MIFVSLFSGFLPISKLGHMTSIGTLLAFVIVCMGIMVMRHTRPGLPRLHLHAVGTAGARPRHSDLFCDDGVPRS